jgi:hypothetical protein
MNSDPAEKIAMIQGSLRCFTFGLMSLLPGIGLPFAVLSLWYAGRARKREKKNWNAAKPYRIWGTVCAVVAGSVWGGLFIIIMVSAFLNS